MLTSRAGLLTKIAALCTIRKRETAFRLVEQALREKAFPRRFFSELFIHLSLFLGYPAMLDGLERLAAITRRKAAGGTVSRGKKGIAKKGNVILRRIYGDQASKLIFHLDQLEEGLGTRIAADAYGAIMSRRGLTLADREIVNVAILFIDGFERQLYSHVRGALRVGVSPRTLKSVLVLASRISGKNALSAIMLLRGVVNTQRSGPL